MYAVDIGNYSIYPAPQSAVLNIGILKVVYCDGFAISVS
jgi:hypothetical protein